MGRYKFIAYQNSSSPRYLVVYGLQWQIIDHQRIEPLYGFVFIRRFGERRLLMLTPRDPFATSQQSFDPFKSASSSGRAVR
jgi:hypothetical protein